MCLKIKKGPNLLLCVCLNQNTGRNIYFITMHTVHRVLIFLWLRDRSVYRSVFEVAYVIADLIKIWKLAQWPSLNKKRNLKKSWRLLWTSVYTKDCTVPFARVNGLWSWLTLETSQIAVWLDTESKQKTGTLSVQRAIKWMRLENDFSSSWSSGSNIKYRRVKEAGSKASVRRASSRKERSNKKVSVQYCVFIIWWEWFVPRLWIWH